MKKLILATAILLTSTAATAGFADKHRCRAINPSTPQFSATCHPRAIMYDYEWVVKRYKAAYQRVVQKDIQLAQMAKKVKKLEAQIKSLKGE